MRTTYTITTSHPRLRHYAGIFSIDVQTNTDGTRYATGCPFGCSKPYRVDNDIQAIRNLTSEHGAILETFKKETA